VSDDQHSGLFIIFIALFFGIPALWAFKDTIKAKASNSEHKKIVDDNWSFLKKRIKGIMLKQQWVDCDDFKDITEVWGISDEAIMYALARYALEFPEQAKFGMVYNNKSRQPVTEAYDHVLVSLEVLDTEKYFYL